MKRIALLSLAFIFISSLSHPAFPAGMARPLGMGGAFIAVSDDINGIAENPAGFCYGKGQELGFYYSGLGDTTAAGIGYRYTFGESSALGVAVLKSFFSSFYYDSQDRFVHVAYSQKIFDNFSLGISLKGETLRLSGISSLEGTGYSADIGLLYIPAKWFTVGLVIENAWKTDIQCTNGSEIIIDKYIKAGIAWRPMEDRLIIAADLSRVSSLLVYDVGIEGKLTDSFYLRGGSSGSSSEMSRRSLFAGLGYYVTPGIVLDLAIGANSTTGSFSWLF
jgi:hypothetical protein